MSNTTNSEITVLIQITAEDIAAGVPGDCGKCPIALAVRRAFKYTDPEDSIAVGTEELEFDPYHMAVFGLTVTLPDAAVDFIRKFDYPEEYLPGPFEFTLTVPKEYMK